MTTVTLLGSLGDMVCRTMMVIDDLSTMVNLLGNGVMINVMFFLCPPGVVVVVTSMLVVVFGDLSIMVILLLSSVVMNMTILLGPPGVVMGILHMILSRSMLVDVMTMSPSLSFSVLMTAITNPILVFCLFFLVVFELRFFLLNTNFPTSSFNDFGFLIKFLSVDFFDIDGSSRHLIGFDNLSACLLLGVSQNLCLSVINDNDLIISSSNGLNNLRITTRGLGADLDVFKLLLHSEMLLVELSVDVDDLLRIARDDSRRPSANSGGRTPSVAGR